MTNTQIFWITASVVAAWISGLCTAMLWQNSEYKDRHREFEERKARIDAEIARGCRRTSGRITGEDK